MLNCPVGAGTMIAEAIETLLRRLPVDQSVWASLNPQFAVDLICDVTVGCVNRGFELPPGVLALLAERGITLGLDIFCRADPREAAALQERLRQI